MKIQNYLYFLLFFALPLQLRPSNCSCETTSHTFFTSRLQFQVASPEVLSSWRGMQWLEEGELSRSAFQAIIYGGQSTNASKLGTYFMPFCSATANTTSTIANTNNALFVQNFNIQSIQFSPFMQTFLEVDPLSNPFSSIITVKPQQSVIALGLSYQYNFCLCDIQHWLRINAPILNVRNSMHLRETILTSSVYTLAPVAGTNLTDPQQNMQLALSQAQWLYGKIDNRIHTKTELAFIQAQLGYILIDNDCYYFSPYIGLTVPTGNTPHGEFVFEPVASNGNHWGVFWGFTSEMALWESMCNDFEIGGAVDINMEYLFNKTHRRSLDLKNRPWSRYNELYASRAQADQVIAAFSASEISQLQAIFINSPGINLLTQKVNVKPGFNFTANLALTFLQQCDNGLNGEFGYNFYAKQAECLHLKDKNFNAQQAALKDHIGIGFTNQIRTITENLLTNEATITNLIVNGQVNPAGAMATYARSIIQETDLDFASASHPATLSHSLYATAGYHWDSCCLPMIVSLGASYEFSVSSNTTLNRWLLWGRWGISF
jgi:hypothetical protein